MPYTTYNCTALTGGASRALDSYTIAGSATQTALATGDRAIVAVGAKLYYFVYDSTATAAENVSTHPYVVRPDDYSSEGNWEEYTSASVDDTAYNATSWNAKTVDAPSKNVVRDKFVTSDAAIDAKAPKDAAVFTPTSNAVGVEIDNDGTNHGAYIHQDGVLGAGKYGLYVVSSAAQINTQLVFINQGSGSSDKAALYIGNAGTGEGLFIDQNGNGIGISVDNAGTSAGIKIAQAGNGIALEVDNDGTNHGAYIHQDGVLAASNYGVYVHSNAAQTTSQLVYIYQQNASSNQAVLYVENAGTGNGLYINQTGAGGGLYVNQVGAGTAATLVKDNSGFVLSITNDGNNVNRQGITMQLGTDDGSGQNLYLFANDGDGGNVGYIENNAGTFRLVDASDERLKENIVVTAVKGLETVNAMKVRDFTFKKSGGFYRSGFIAQELFKVFPEGVSVIGEEKMMGVSKERLVPVLAKAIQEQHENYLAQQAEIGDLLAKVAALEAA